MTLQPCVQKYPLGSNLGRVPVLGVELLLLIPLLPVLVASCPVKVAIFASAMIRLAVSNVTCLARSELVVVRVMNAVLYEVVAVARFARAVAVDTHVPGSVAQSGAESEYNTACTVGIDLAHFRMLIHELLKNIQI